MFKRSLLIVGVATALSLTGCGGESSHEHEGHDHADGHDHAAETAKATDAAAKPYPLKTCIVSGEDLASMGEPVVMVHEGQQIKFCCDSCVGDFKKDPAKYLAKLPK